METKGFEYYAKRVKRSGNNRMVGLRKVNRNEEEGIWRRWDKLPNNKEERVAAASGLGRKSMGQPRVRG